MGWATLDGGNMVLRLPHPKRHVLSAARLAWLTEHELYHSYGHRHGRFTEESPEWWARHVGDGDLPLKTRRARAARDLVEERATKTRRMLAVWTRRMKMAERKVKMYERKVRYYERAAAARLIRESRFRTASISAGPSPSPS